MKTTEDIKFLSALGKHLRHLREKNNLSIRELETLCDLDRGRISEYEHGKTNPSATALYKLSIGLGVHPKELFNFPIPPSGEQ